MRIDAQRPLILLRLLAAALALGLADCLPGRYTGTSTSVGDTADGFAMLANGKAASGALVCARSGTLEFLDGRPQSVLLDSARADGEGGFRFHMERLEGSFYLEILCDQGSACAGNKEQAFFKLIVAPADLDGRRFALSPPGSLVATARWTRMPDSIVWVGLRGTARFAKPSLTTDPDGSVSAEARFEGLGAGAYELVGFGKDMSGARTRPLSILPGQVTETGLP